MKIEWMNLPERYAAGMRDFLRFHGIEEGEGGLRVRLAPNQKEGIAISMEGGEVELRLDDRGRVYRALTIL